MSKKIKNPNQPIIFDEHGCIRFKKNKIVNKMLDICTENGYGLHEIFCEFDVKLGKEDNDDYTQLMQLIGYSINGYGELSTSPKKKVKKFDKKAEKMTKKRCNSEKR